MIRASSALPVTSPWRVSASPPAARTAPATASAAVAALPVVHGDPGAAAAEALATAAPMPVLAPVTSTALPCRSSSIVSSLPPSLAPSRRLVMPRPRAGHHFRRRGEFVGGAAVVLRRVEHPEEVKCRTVVATDGGARWRIWLVAAALLPAVAIAQGADELASMIEQSLSGIEYRLDLRPEQAAQDLQEQQRRLELLEQQAPDHPELPALRQKSQRSRPGRREPGRCRQAMPRAERRRPDPDRARGVRRRAEGGRHAAEAGRIGFLMGETAEAADFLEQAEARWRRSRSAMAARSRRATRR